MSHIGGVYHPIGQRYKIYHNHPYMNQPLQGTWNHMAQPNLPFLATLNLPNLLKLTNDLVSHDPMWSVVTAKIPLNILNFEGKNGEEPRENITTFHLWCSSNSLNHDSAPLCLFQHTLMTPMKKWYIEFPRGTYHTFNDLAMTFLNKFQIPVHYDDGTEILLTFR